MSLKSWKNEFYKIPANKVPIRDALEHSLRKWEGLTETNLKKHKINLDKAMLIDNTGNQLILDEDTCALCVHYSYEEYEEYEECEECPLKLIRGCSCDESLDSNTSPYGEMYFYGNIDPMVKLLRKALNKQRGNKCL